MKYKILIIEDEKKTSEYLSKALNEEGFDVACAEDGEAGIDKLRQSKYDLIVLDLKMPKKNGDEILSEIRDLYPYIHVVVYTNYDDPTVMQKLINLGVDGFLKKGASANLWDMVEFIKSKLDPVDEKTRKELLTKMFNQLKIQNDGEVLS